MPKVSNLLGQKFGRLTVVARSEKVNRHTHWQCTCECGTNTTVAAHRLKAGTTKSCGCLAREKSAKRAATMNFKHGCSGPSHRTPEYGIWRGMIARCTSESNHAYKYYGGRGITIHPAWLADFTAFLSDVGERPSPEFTLDRIDNDRGYEPGNVRWATWIEQANNRRPPDADSYPRAGSFAKGHAPLGRALALLNSGRAAE